MGRWKLATAPGAALAAALAFAGPGVADVLYDNGGPVGINATAIFAPAETANSFTLVRAAEITSIAFTAFIDVGATLEEFEWAFLDDAMSSGGATIASAVVTDYDQSGVLANPLGGYDLRTFRFDVGSVGLAAGTYWLRLGGARTSGFVEDPRTFWDQSFGPSAAERVVNGGAAMSFPSNSFQIHGTAVPEPATWGLMILGLGGAGAMLRSRRHVKQPAAGGASRP
jgi:hypothetical protein